MPDSHPLDVVGRVREAARRLTPAERKVAEVVAADPQAVAFGTVAELARRSGSSGATVVRLAARLGFDGFAELQEAVRGELADRLRPAASRIREPGPDDIVATTLESSVRALTATLGAVDADDFAVAVALLADPDRAVWVVPGDAAGGVLRQAGQELSMLRPGVEVVEGNPVAVARRLARAEAGDVAVVLDVRRYERWLAEVADRWVAGGGELVALTDGPLSPLAEHARVLFVVDAAGVGPFDDQVGALALLGALVTGVARSRRTEATESLDRIEAAWADADALDHGA